MIAISFEPFALMASVIGVVNDRYLVERVRYDNLLRATWDVYRENMVLRARLRDLERLASSWTGTPERSGEIVRAREALRDNR